MEFKDLLAQSIAVEKAEPENKLPEWVSPDNASLAAYQAINSFKKDKLTYISKHKTATAFRIAKTFQVQKKEVADKIGATTQAIFYASSYSEKLLEYLEGKKGKGGVNNELMKRKDERIAKPRTGLASKPKSEVYSTAQDAKKRIEELEAKNASEQLALAIAKLPLNVRDKLKLR
jgi:predicted transcriptional regulator